MANKFDTDPDNGTITIVFSNPRGARHFKSWLSGQGEQDYWIWMDAREEDEPGEITCNRFDYWHEDPNTIPAPCTRTCSGDDD